MAAHTKLQRHPHKQPSFAGGPTAAASTSRSLLRGILAGARTNHKPISANVMVAQPDGDEHQRRADWSITDEL